MINKLRVQLTLWFTLLVMLVYCGDAGFAVWLFDRQLTAMSGNDLTRLCQEISPDIKYHAGVPTLREWGSGLRRGHLLNAVQLFDSKQNLLERYGMPGFARLADGRVGNRGATYYSAYQILPAGGYIQAQVSSRPHDEAVRYFLLSKLARLVIIVILLLLCGWFFSAQAVGPVVSALQALRTFVDDAGHELNTPVTLIQSSVETLERDLQDRGVSTHVLRVIRSASNRLRNLSSNLLLLAKLENPEMVLRLAPIYPHEVLAEIFLGLGEAARGKGVTIVLDRLPPVQVLADSDAFARLFTNLIENAIRYTPKGGTIRISGSKQYNSVAIAVSDTGLGIAKECLPHIFDRFYRVDKARSNAAGGSGLGLAIVKAIVNAHHGTIRADSEEGKGTTIVVTLPVLF